jgi:hypothetical protein
VVFFFGATFFMAVFLALAAGDFPLALSPGIMPAKVLATLPAGSTVDAIRRGPDQMLALVCLARSMTKAMSSSSLKAGTTELLTRMVADAGESNEFITPKYTTNDGCPCSCHSTPGRNS